MSEVETGALGRGRIEPRELEQEMRSSFLDYAMSVIVSRALPDVRDGLKPVHRRVLYGMHEVGLQPNRPYKKSASTVGAVMANYHPHGDSAIYDTLVRMAQPFSLRYPLVDGQGNFGSIDDDPAAAMRYTEARLSRIATEMLRDLDSDTVDFVPNYDGSQQEPLVLPSRFPNLLVNGSTGIAVGMASNIPPHNLREVAEAVKRLVDDPDLTNDDLCETVLGPDFPGGGVIYRLEEQKNIETGALERVDAIRRAYANGRGRILMRAKAHVEDGKGGRQSIIVTELPYAVNKATLIEKIADLVQSKRLAGISDIRDESDREGMRVAIEVKRDDNADRVLNNLYKHTAMQSAFNLNMLALVDSSPKTLSLKDVLQHYIDYRKQVIKRRTEFDLGRAKERAHVLEGFKIALDHIDEIVKTIRASKTPETALANLREKFELSEIQAKAILEMQLRRLTGLERQKVEDEYRETIKLISELESILGNPRKILFLVKQDM